MTTVHIFRQHCWAWLVLLAGLFTPLAQADDAALYGPEAPPGSAFVRMFNATPTSLTNASIGGEPVETLDQFEASDYVFVPAGTHRISTGSEARSESLEADRYYTVTVDAGGLQVHSLRPPDDGLKALVVFYNLTADEALQLKTEDGATPIAEAGAGAFATREVNPLRITLGVFSGDRKLATTEPVNLARGRAFSLFVTPGRGQPRLTWVID